MSGVIHVPPRYSTPFLSGTEACSRRGSDRLIARRCTALSTNCCGHRTRASGWDGRSSRSATRGSPFLSESQRDTLWDRFEVPIYALLVDAAATWSGTNARRRTGCTFGEEYAAGLLPGEVESKLCECGRPGPRLMPG